MTKKVIELDNEFGSAFDTCNDIFLIGVIDEEFMFSHFFNGENFYKAIIEVKRLSEKSDYLPIIVCEREISNVDEYRKGTVVEIRGNIRSFYKLIDEKKMQMEMYICPYYLKIVNSQKALEADEFLNFVKLRGYICREPYSKIRGEGKQIVECMIRVKKKRGNKKFVSIPCVSWYDNAKYMSKCKVGDKVTIIGRFQSREYTKVYHKTGEEVKRVVHEVAVAEVE